MSLRSPPLIVVKTLVLAGCLRHGIHPAQPLGTFAEFPAPAGGSAPYGITQGPDGHLWFTEFKGNKIGRIAPNGLVQEFAVPTPGAGPHGITLAPDGNVWFTELGANKIGRIGTGAKT